jgi:hypothetical protein
MENKIRTRETYRDTGDRECRERERRGLSEDVELQLTPEAEGARGAEMRERERERCGYGF